MKDIIIFNRRKMMQFNEEVESQKIKEFILNKIENQSNDEKIKFIQFGYQFDQRGFFCVFMDTRPDAKPDGTWTMRIDGNSLKRPQWPIFLEDYDEEEFALILGEMIKSTILSLRDEGAFNKLNKYEDCELGIEELNGYYGWPNYEDRGKENLA